MYKLDSSGRGHDMKQVGICTSLKAVVHDMKQVSVCTSLIAVVGSMT